MNAPITSKTKLSELVRIAPADVLASDGIRTLGDALQKTPTYLLRYRNVGNLVIKEIRTAGALLPEGLPEAWQVPTTSDLKVLASTLEALTEARDSLDSARKTVVESILAVKDVMRRR